MLMTTTDLKCNIRDTQWVSKLYMKTFQPAVYLLPVWGIFILGDKSLKPLTSNLNFVIFN